MKRVTGLGGIFFKSGNRQETMEWYRKHLGIDAHPDWGAMFEFSPGQKGYNVWSVFKEDSNYLDPSTQPFMVNFIVENFEDLLKALQEEGIPLIGEPQISEYGKFAWILDPNGIKLELWEPPAS